MNRYRGVLNPSALEQGDIVQISVQATNFLRRDKTRGPEGGRTTHTYGYVMAKPLFQTQKNDIPGFEILEILPFEHASRLDRPYMVINHEDTGRNLGLHQDKQWAVVLEPIHINATPGALGRNDGLIQRVGKISGMVAESKLIEQIEKIGGEDRLRFGPGDGPKGFARPSEETWGYFARGLARTNFKDDEFTTAEEKRSYRRKHDFVGQVVDMDLSDAVKTLALPKEIAAMFTLSRGRGKRPITSLRAAWDMADKNPDALKEFMPETKDLSENPSLEELINTEIDMAIVNGLASPKKGTDVAPVTDLKAAYDLVTAPDAEDRMGKYMFLGPVNRALAKEEIPAAYEKRIVQQEKDPQAIARVLKSAWKDFMSGYATFKQTQEIPEGFRREDGTPVWKLVDLKP